MGTHGLIIVQVGVPDGDDRIEIWIFDLDFRIAPLRRIDDRYLPVLDFVLLLPCPLLFLLLLQLLAIDKRRCVDVLLFRFFLLLFVLQLDVEDIIEDGVLGSIGLLALLCADPLQRYFPRSLPRFLALNRHIKRLLIFYLAARPELEVLQDLLFNLMCAGDLVLPSHALNDRVVSIFDGVLRSGSFQLTRN